MLHRALLSMEFLFLWHHCHPGNIVILLWLTHSQHKICPAYTPLAGTVHFGTVLFLSVVIDEIKGVPNRDNVSGILMLPPAGGVTSSCTVQNRSVLECIFHDGGQLLHQW